MDLKPYAPFSSDDIYPSNPWISKKQVKNLDNYQNTSETLLFEGEFRLLKGELSEGLKLFETACSLDPSNWSMLFRQGLALIEYGAEEKKKKPLILAIKKFKQALTLNSQSFEILHAWANALALLGEIEEEYHYFVEAENKYCAAFLYSQNQKNDILADLFWEYAVVCMQISKHSEEAFDVQKALNAFQKATTFVHHFPLDFWIDFGKASLKFASLINDNKQYIKAINCFKTAISLNRTSFEAWKYLAKSLELLYYNTHDEDHFAQASECYASTMNLQPHDSELLLDHAKLLCHSSRKTQDIKQLRNCLEKYHRAYASDPTNPLILANWAEALALLGEFSDRLDLIIEAQNKISEATDLEEEDNIEILYCYGMCLNSFARYFNDFDYYYQSIEKFQSGLSIDRTDHKLWHAMAQTYTAVGLLESDIEEMKKSFKFYTNAIGFFPSTYYIFDYAQALYKFGELTQCEHSLQLAQTQFELALSLQKNAIYLHPDWLFYHGCTLDLLGDFHEEDFYYTKAIEIFSHVLMIDPNFPCIHHRLAQAFCHLGELSEEPDYFHRALHHLRLASKQNEEDDQILLDWGLTLMHIAQYTQDSLEMDQTYREAEHKLSQAAKLGNLQGYYYLACLFSILKQYEIAMHFILKADGFKSLPPVEEILQDEWLDGLRATSAFREFLSQMENRPNLRD